jgi:hypothetical protein
MMWTELPHKILGLGEAAGLWRAAIDVSRLELKALAPVRRKVWLSSRRVDRLVPAGGVGLLAASRIPDAAGGISSAFVRRDLPLQARARPLLRPSVQIPALGRKFRAGVSIPLNRKIGQGGGSKGVRLTNLLPPANRVAAVSVLSGAAMSPIGRSSEVGTLGRKNTDRGNGSLRLRSIHRVGQGQAVRVSPAQTKSQRRDELDRLPALTAVPNYPVNRIVSGNGEWSRASMSGTETRVLARKTNPAMEPEPGLEDAANPFRFSGAGYIVRHARMPPSGMSGYDPRLTPAWAGLQISG